MSATGSFLNRLISDLNKRITTAKLPCEDKTISKLIAELFDGPIDIVGDVHGEINALRLLLWHLGYNKKGQHPEGRRLVFLGDLVDRGPDSPAVVELVSQFVQNGRAQCILGNHELNLLREQHKDGNDWFITPDTKGKYPARTVSEQQKVEFRRFLLGLPVALERDDLRVVHASWNRVSIDKLRQLDDGVTALEAYNRFENDLVRDYLPSGMTKLELDRLLKDQENPPEIIPGLAEHDTNYQMGNPVRVATSGEEAPAYAPFWAGGKWRMVARQKWWESYDEEPSVIMGHYWRRYRESATRLGDKAGPDLFAGVKPHHWMGKRNNVYCVDFSVGLKHLARAENRSKLHFKLAAVRWPEGVVVYDDGVSTTTAKN